MKKLLFCIIALTAAPISATIDIELTYSEDGSLTHLQSLSFSAHENETLQNLIARITKKLSSEEKKYIITSCEGGMARNLLDKKLQMLALKEVFKSTGPSMWINC